MNATLQGGIPVQSDSVDISIAVATPNGLITPIVQNAAKLGVAEISSKVKVTLTISFIFLNLVAYEN